MQATGTEVEVDKRNVLVIHGRRNKDIRDSIFDFLRAIGLSPMEWDDAVALTGVGSPYVGEVVGVTSNQAHAVVALLTGDDLARLHPDLCTLSDNATFERHQMPQPRPNVLFEAGMALASHPTRTVLVQIGELRPFRYLDARHVISLDNTSRKRHQLATCLETVGCPIDLNGADWLTTGNFEVVTPSLAYHVADDSDSMRSAHPDSIKNSRSESTTSAQSVFVEWMLRSSEMHLSKIRQFLEFLPPHVGIAEVEAVDRYNARVYLSRDVLSTAMSDLIEILPTNVLNYLEDVWFRDVMRLEAYLRWEQRGADPDSPADLRTADHRNPLEMYRRILADQSIKREPKEFVGMRDHIIIKYMQDNAEILNPDKRAKLVARKAEALAMSAKKRASPYKDWCDAAAYVDIFYNNIIPAVMRGDEPASQAVREAILRSEGKNSRLSIMNCLEAAICMYFFRGFEYRAGDWKESS